MVVPLSCTSCKRVMLSDLEPAKALRDMVTAKTNRATRASIRVIGNLLYSFWRPTQQKRLAFPAKSHKMSLRGQTATGNLPKPPLKLSRLGRQTAGETFCLAPILLIAPALSNGHLSSGPSQRYV